MLLFSLFPINNRKLCQRIPSKDQANRGEQHEARVVDYHMLPRSNHGRVLIVAHFWHQTTCHNIGIPYCLYLRHLVLCALERHGYPNGNTWRFVALSLKMVHGCHHGNLLIRKVPNPANLGRFVNSIISKVASEIASTAPHAKATQTRTACNFETLNVPLGKTRRCKMDANGQNLSLVLAGRTYHFPIQLADTKSLVSVVCVWCLSPSTLGRMGQSCSLVLFRFRFGTTRNSASSEDLRWRSHWNRRSTSVRLTARLMFKALEAPHFKGTHNLGGASNAFASAFQVALLCFPCYLLFLFVACKLTYLAKFFFTLSPSFSFVYSCLF